MTWARPGDQIQADLGALAAAKARPEKVVQFPDRRRVQYRDMYELLRSIPVALRLNVLNGLVVAEAADHLLCRLRWKRTRQSCRTVAKCPVFSPPVSRVVELWLAFGCNHLATTVGEWWEPNVKQWVGRG